MSNEQEVLAIRYGTVASSRRQLFHGYELYNEPDASLAMDYFFWVIRSREEIILVDTGFGPDVGRRRGRTLLIEPVEALRRLGITASQVSRILVTHCHYDHIGNLPLFPDATITVQRQELDFWTGPDARRCQIGHVVEADEVDYLRAAVREGRVQLLNGDTELSSGIRTLMVGGHSPGQQITIIETKDQPIVLASDALHFYEELERDMPFAIFTDLIATYRAYDLLRELEARGGIVAAGHDPSVVNRFARYSEESREFAFRIA